MTISTTRAVEPCERLAALGPPPTWWRVFALRRWLREHRAIMALDISVSAEILRSLYPAGRARLGAGEPTELRADPEGARVSQRCASQGIAPRPLDAIRAGRALLCMPAEPLVLSLPCSLVPDAVPSRVASDRREQARAEGHARNPLVKAERCDPLRFGGQTTGRGHPLRGYGPSGERSWSRVFVAESPI